jgi:hypothetical protein
MITETKGNTLLSNTEKLDKAEYYVNTDSSHIAQILRDMYSQPYIAVAREYVANAVDAHVSSDRACVPIMVGLPDPNALTGTSFTVRDFGDGLSLEDTKKLLFGYGSSGDDKRDSNKAIGGFGIGAKCAFSISDQFLFTVYYEGTCKIWNCYLDAHDNSQAELISDEVNTEDPSGILVSIPIDTNDAHKFKANQLLKLYRYLKVPVLVKDDNHDTTNSHEFKQLKKAAEGSLRMEVDGIPFDIKWEYKATPMTTGDKDITCSIGGFQYAVKSDLNLTKGFTSRIFLRLPIGFVPLAPNRESIKYTRHTTETLNKLVSYLKDEVKTQVTKTGTRIEKYNLLGSLGVPESFEIPNIPTDVSFLTSEIKMREAYNYHNVLDEKNVEVTNTTVSTWKTIGPANTISLAPTDSMHSIYIVMVKGKTGTIKMEQNLAKFMKQEKHRLAKVISSIDLKGRNDIKVIPVVMFKHTPELEKLFISCSDTKDGTFQLMSFEADLEKKSYDNWSVEVPVGEGPYTSLKGRGYYYSTRSTYRSRTSYAVSKTTKLLTFAKPEPSQCVFKPYSKYWESKKLCDMVKGQDVVYTMIDGYVPYRPEAPRFIRNSMLQVLGDMCNVPEFREHKLLPENITGIKKKDEKNIPDSYIPLHTFIKEAFERLLKSKEITIHRLAWFILGPAQEKPFKCVSINTKTLTDTPFEGELNLLLSDINKIRTQIKDTELLTEAKRITKNLKISTDLTDVEKAAYSLYWFLAGTEHSFILKNEIISSEFLDESEEAQFIAQVEASRSEISMGIQAVIDELVPYSRLSYDANDKYLIRIVPIYQWLLRMKNKYPVVFEHFLLHVTRNLGSAQNSREYNKVIYREQFKLDKRVDLSEYIGYINNK